MASVVDLARPQQKPPYGTPFDPGSPLTRGLLPSFHMLAQGEAANLWPYPHSAASGTWTTFLTAIAKPSPWGSAWQFPGGGEIFSTDFVLPLTNFTMALLVNVTSVSNEVHIECRSGNTGTQQLLLYLPYSDGHLYPRFGGSGSPNGLDWAPPASWFGTWHQLVWSVGAHGAYLWSDGLLKASGSGNVARTSGALGLDLDALYGGVNGNSYAQVLFYNREWTQADVLLHYRRPFDMFLRAPAGIAVPLLVATSASVTVTPSTLALTLATVAPTLSGAATSSPSAQALTLALLAPTVSTTQFVTVTPAALALTLAVGAPTPSGGATISPSAQALTLAVLAPTVTTTASVTATPGTLALTLAVQAPSVTAGGSVTVSPSALALTLALLTPTAAAGAGVTPATLALTLAVGAMTFSGGSRATPATLALTLAALAPFLGEQRDITVRVGAGYSRWTTGAGTGRWTGGEGHE